MIIFKGSSHFRACMRRSGRIQDPNRPHKQGRGHYLAQGQGGGVQSAYLHQTVTVPTAQQTTDTCYYDWSGNWPRAFQRFHSGTNLF